MNFRFILTFRFSHAFAKLPRGKNVCLLPTSPGPQYELQWNLERISYKLYHTNTQNRMYKYADAEALPEGLRSRTAAPWMPRCPRRSRNTESRWRSAQMISSEVLIVGVGMQKWLLRVLEPVICDGEHKLLAQGWHRLKNHCSLQENHSVFLRWALIS